MSRKDSKRISYWLTERNLKATGVKSSKLENLHATVHRSKHENELDFCNFVGNCDRKAQQKKIMKNAFKNLPESKHLSYPSIFSKF